MSRQLFKSTAVVGSMTLVSRLLGFVRDMLIAHLFGVDSATDAFFVAFKIPNFLRRLFAEGAFAHAFVPVLSDYKERANPVALKLFIDKTAGTLSVFLLALTLIGVVAAPVLIMLLAPGFIGQGSQYELSVQLLQITFPYLFFITLVAFAGGILNAHGRFAIPALTPVFLNICMITAAIWLAPLMSEPVTALAWGVFAAGVVQLLFQLPALARLGLMPRPRLGFSDPGVKRIVNLMLPAIFSVSVTQINLFLDTLIASFLTVGSVSWLYYSDRLVEFPLGILGIALATVILPNLSKSHAADDMAAFSSALDWGLRLVVLVGLPATIGLVLLAEPMLSTLFQYNEFGVSDVHFAGLSLKAYSLGLLGFILIKVLVPGFSSRGDMKTPVRYGVYALLVSLALNLLLVFPLAHAGLALATSLGAYFNAALLLMKLHKDKVYQPAKGGGLFFTRIALASGVMAAGLFYFVDTAWWNDWSSTVRVLNLLKWIGLGLACYTATLWLTGLRLRHLAGQ
ncbi:MAG: murein biosynthesis integral membrane protein MurJ [Methylobacter sp.]|nr:murein biosynthesis integral membrane protein MurJ [Methylobacter sp.]MDP2430370.1 murein biosynthesis integral membrane protein MurJ [Methylobacter sp.]MDP3053538.1 murein biosynthesis integral membrane protein MurJ [Methylobacter sp.]MDP3362717.1 murein biosynthesis integral membrane protein MurJ [Methylobacter sp.]MDZ4217741.1 murein biosynthesis integral membrane protein MurJ [Methylobacter sp.]